MDSAISIRPATTGDAQAIVAIYNHYIRDTIVSFEEEPLAAETMASRLEAVTEQGYPWLVAEAAGEVLGFAYGSPWNKRPAYRSSAEVTVYVHVDHPRRGIGRALYTELFERLGRMGMHTLIGGIALPNPGSQGLHESFGFRQVAHYEQVGHKFGRFIDVGYWQLLLKPRAPE